MNRSHVGKSIIGFPFFLLLGFMLSVNSFAQVHEVGVGIGALSYTGDLTKNYDIISNRPAITGFYRRNIDNVISIRFNGVAGLIQGKDDGFDSFSVRRNRSFSTLILEASARVEYNFIDYKSSKSLTRWSPYFFAGAGAFVIDFAPTGIYRQVQPVVPFGMGVKVLHRKVWNFGVDFAAHKTFFDYLDRVSELTEPSKNYTYGNPNDNDWYYSITFTLSYTIFKVPCPYPYNPFQSTPSF